ncbi:MAG: hypothetical protein ACXQS8_01385 [Candidatus Helarchaeales archaeon]
MVEMEKPKRSQVIETPYGPLRVERFLNFARFRAKCHICELWTLNEMNTFIHDNKYTCTHCFKEILKSEEKSLSDEK